MMMKQIVLTQVANGWQVSPNPYFTKLSTPQEDAQALRNEPGMAQNYIAVTDTHALDIVADLMAGRVPLPSGFYVEKAEIDGAR